MGLSDDEFWDMTPFELHIENQSFEMKFKREHLLELQLLNTVLSFCGADRTSFEDVLGYKQLKDLKFKSFEDFVFKGKFNKEKYDEYVKNVVIPTKRKEGLA